MIEAGEGSGSRRAIPDGSRYAIPDGVRRLCGDIRDDSSGGLWGDALHGVVIDLVQPLGLGRGEGKR